jgi:hypothetical protein
VTSQAAFGPPFFRRRTAKRGLSPFCATLAVATLCAGCATERAYEGPRLPAAERAIVRADPVVSAGSPIQIRIRQVDGHDVGFSASKVELPPGKHALVVDCRIAETGSVRRFTLEEELDAGGHYRVVADTTGRNCEAVALIGD